MTIVSTAVAHPPYAVVRRRFLNFYTGLPIAMALAVFVGFAPTYYMKTAFGTPALAPLYHVHGFLFTCWMLLLIIQPALVATGRTALHRRVGVAGGLLAAGMVVAALAVSIDLGRRGASPPGVPPLVFLVVPLTTVVVFPVLIGAALLWRNRPQIHKRLMLIGSMELITAGFGRWPVVGPLGPLAYFAATDIFVLALLVHDRATTGRFHRATLWGGLFLIASQPLRLMIGGTDTWQAFARWLIA
jgi:hypothetical protein